MSRDIHIYKTEQEFNLMRKANRMATTVLEEACKRAKPGVSTWDLDIFAEQWIRDNGAIPTFKGYMGFPCTLCTSVNSEVVHGIPRKESVLKDGDIISIDVGVTVEAIVNGVKSKFVGDNAKTVPVGNVPDRLIKLIADTKAGLEAGCAECKPGNKISDIAKAVEDVAKIDNYGLVTEFGGHGVGPEYHCAPFIPNFTSYFRQFPDGVIQEGMVLAVEPMFNLGVGDIRKLRDGWTIVTKDKKLSAHYEYSLLVTSDGPEILSVIQPWDKLDV